MKLKHAIFVCLVIALAALLLTACNPNTPEDTTAPTTTAPTTTVPPVTTTEPSAVVTTTVPPVTTTVPTPPVTTTVPTPPVTTTVPPVTTTVPTPIVVTPTFTGLTAEYDGEDKTVAVSGLPAGATVSYSVNGGDPVSSVAVSDAGTYTVLAYITLPVSYAPINDPMTATITITKKSITIADLAPFGWVYDEQVGYDAELGAIRVESDDVFSYTMTLDADTLEVLAENGITVSYTTVKAVGTDTEPVGNEVTARGVYQTVAVLTVDSNNYEATDDGYEIELDWAICLSDASSWTPVVK